MRGWVIYKRQKEELSEIDHGVNRLLEAAETLGVELEVLKPAQFDLMVTSASGMTLLFEGAPITALPDFILPRLGAETPYNILCLLREMERRNVYCVNTADSIEKVADKFLFAELLQQRGLPIPTTMLLKTPLAKDVITQQIGFPLVLKTVSGSRGVGVCLCESMPALQDLLGLLGLFHADKAIILQQFITNSYGRDLRVFVLNHQVIGCMLRTSKNSFKANYSLGGDVSYHPITLEINDLAIACTQLLGLEIAGIDLLFGENGLLICEANSSPGFKGMEKATGMDVASQILTMIIEKIRISKTSLLFGS